MCCQKLGFQLWYLPFLELWGSIFLVGRRKSGRWAQVYFLFLVLICFLKYRNVNCGKHKVSKLPSLSQALGTVILIKKDQIWPLRVSQVKKAVRSINNLIDCVRYNNGDMHSISWEHQKKGYHFYLGCQGGDPWANLRRRGGASHKILQPSPYPQHTISGNKFLTFHLTFKVPMT